MKKIKVSKAGVGTVIFMQTVNGNVTMTRDGIDQIISTEEANRIYTAYLSKGWTAKVIPVKELAAPQEKSKTVEKPKKAPEFKTREEALTAKYGDITKRREYIALRNKAIKSAKEDIYEWVKSHHRLTKDQYLDQLKKGTARYLAQYQAEMTAM